MQYAATRTTLPSRRSILVPLVALVVGAAAAVGGYALIDNQDTAPAPGKVVFVDTPGPGAGVRGIDDMANATALTSTPPKVVVPYLSHGGGVQSSDSTPKVAPHLSHGGPPTSDASSANRTDPHGPAALLHTH
jgi:hypothetical protein